MSKCNTVLFGTFIYDYITIFTCILREKPSMKNRLLLRTAGDVVQLDGAIATESSSTSRFWVLLFLLALVFFDAKVM